MRQVLRFIALLLVAGLCVGAVKAAGVSPLTIDPPGGAAAIPRAYFGIHVHNDGAQRNWPDIAVGSLRLWDAGVTWSALEPVRGEWDFRRLDEYVAWARGRGIEVLLTLGVTPRWASARPDEAGVYGKGMAAEPANIEDWRNYVRRVVEHCKGRVAAYQVWNEANLPEFYSGSPAAMRRLAAVAQQEIRRGDPAARLVMPSGMGLDHRVGWLAQTLAAGMKDSVDIAAFHLYHGKEPPESMIDPVQRMLALRSASSGPVLPIWNTESGYAIATPHVAWRPEERAELLSVERVAEFLPRDMLLARALGFERYFWYDWDGNRMGMLDPGTGQRRSVAEVYAQLIQALAGTVLHRCERGGTGLWTCRLSGADGGMLRAYWTDPAAPAQRQILTLRGVQRMLLDGKSSWRAAEGTVEIGPVVTLVSGRP